LSLKLTQRISFGSTLFLFLIACSTSTGDSNNQIRHQETMPTRNINVVLEDHDEALMAIPGVIGVYVGLLPDEVTPCLKIIVIKKPNDLVGKIPKSIEGYPVVIEESGIVHPMK